VHRQEKSLLGVDAETNVLGEFNQVIKIHDLLTPVSEECSPAYDGSESILNILA